MTPIPLGVLASGRRAAASGSVEYIGRVADGTDSLSYTFTSVPIGTPDASRVLILSVSIYGGIPGAGVLTVNGATATADYAESSGDEHNGRRSDFYRAAVPSGSTADIGLTLTAGGYPPFGVTVSVYSIKGFIVAYLDGAMDTSSPFSIAPATSAGGVVFAGITPHNQLTTITFNWTGIAESFAVRAADHWASGGFAYPTSAGTTAITVDPTANSAGRLRAASYTLS